MKRSAAGMVICIGLWLGLNGPAAADVAVVVEHIWTIGNDNFSSFGYDPATESFRTGGYGAFQELRYSRILDDTVLPWVMTGDILLTVDQLDLFARDGDPFKTGSFVTWGMNFNPLDGRYFVTVDATLRQTPGGPRLDAERDLVVLDDRLPDSILPAFPTEPTYTVVANTNGVFSLKDRSENLDGSPRAAFVSRGVQPGHRLTLYPLELFQPITPGTYSVTAVVSETELHLDADPLPTPNSSVQRVGYLLSLQPHLTLATFRQKIPYFANTPTTGPRARWKGGLSPDGTTLYLGEEISDNLIAVNTQVTEDFDIFIPRQVYVDYVFAERAAGRRKADLDPVVYRTVSFATGWDTENSVNTTVNPRNTAPIVKYSGSYSVLVRFDGAGAVLDLQTITPLSPAEYDTMYYFLHGGVTGGQQIEFTAYDSGGVESTPLTLPAPPVEDWSRYEVDLGGLGLADIQGFRWKNPLGTGQPAFYMDEVRLEYLVLPEDYGDFSTNGNASVSSRSQTHCDESGRVWFSHGETDDILYTDDGVTLHTFLRSNDFFQAVSNFELGLFSGTVPSTGMGIAGLIVDPMGTVYFGEERTREIWKCPARGGAENIRRLATREEIQAALGMSNDPRGLNCFTLRGKELLTYNYIDSNTIYKVDLKTFQYGDVDQDFDADLADYALFQQCFGLDPIPEGCETADINEDGSVDLDDYAQLAAFLVGPG